MSHVSCLMSHVSCLMSHVSCLMSHVSCLMSHVSCLMSHVACLMSHVSCLSPTPRIPVALSAAYLCVCVRVYTLSPLHTCVFVCCISVCLYTLSSCQILLQQSSGYGTFSGALPFFRTLISLVHAHTTTHTHNHTHSLSHTHSKRLRRALQLLLCVPLSY
jgi:hypothetical protein